MDQQNTVGLFSILDKKAPFFTVEEQARLVQAIRNAEQATSGEIRLYVESKNPQIDPLDRASEVFHKLLMHETENRNAVLIYVAMKHREVALFADEGIYQKVGQVYWEAALKHMLSHFNENDILTGLEHCIYAIGETLKEKFPYQRDTDKNELPDDIVFGH